VGIAIEMFGEEAQLIYGDDQEPVQFRFSILPFGVAIPLLLDPDIPSGIL
jgi:hypothetical protein